MDLSTPAGLESLARTVAEQLGADHAEKDGDLGPVRIVYADGRTLELVPNRPRTRITVTAVLPEQASAHDIEVKPITVTAQPLPRDGETQTKATARHTADHIRQRLLPAHTSALAELGERTAPQVATLQRADAALAGFLDHPQGGVAIADQTMRRPLGLTARCAVAWWHTLDGPSRAVAPFLADALRRAQLATTEPHASGYVFFAEPPAEQSGTRFRISPTAQGEGWDLVDEFTGACVRTYADQEWAQQIADSANGEEDTARSAAAASMDLAGMSADLIDSIQFRQLATELATAGHMPYGLDDVDYTQTPGFLILEPGGSPGVARVARVLEPWGSVRPGSRREAPEREAERYDADLETYAQLLTRPGRTAAVMPDGIQVTFNDPPTRP
ncbi:hypothetical protein OHB35_53285 [Streptomyces phaeochromogenes]|uniref:Uncharacterized protein n=1 Tax=Streptomyces phaeochromogenes TaxID=1923 RepID=A0ABZ1HRS7_STRPH|nr:hypothetical protein [Streptomyces phaeochromogenes]WSD11737.1 hypothetical protein OHB35_00050 [Streptomyces phaeochromogenes]WSD21312.1 hypothetical protein OHB35_53285 [Streptomyces phaeochromogenes]